MGVILNLIQNLVPMGKVCAGKSEAGKNKINTSFYMEEKQNNIIQTDTSKRNVISSLLWKFLERGGTQGVQFVLSVVLARLVSPADYGVIALILIFIQIATVFVQSGFNTALIQKRNADEVDFSSVLYMSLAVAAVMYAVLFFASPFIASFYGNSVLCPLVRVLSLTLFFGALNSVQSAYVSKTMQFRRFFFSSMGGALGSGIAGIILAYKGFGVWALVTQQLVNISLMCVILWFTVEWRPKLIFSLQRTKTLFCFGWKLLCSGLLDTVFRNIYGLLIGKIYNSTQLGYFNRGQQFPSVIATNLDGSIQSVMLPALSAHNDSKEEVKRLARRSISTSSYLLMPCMFGLAAIAGPLVRILLTEKWLSCVPFLQLACISYALYPIHTANLTAINAMGRSDIFLKLEIIKKCVTVLTLCITARLGIMAMAIGQVITSFISIFINSYPNGRLLNYRYREQLADIFSPLVLALIMFAFVWCVGLLRFSDLATLLIQLPVGALVYFAGSRLLKLDSYIYLVGTIKGFRK